MSLSAMSSSSAPGISTTAHPSDFSCSPVAFCSVSSSNKSGAPSGMLWAHKATRASEGNEMQSEVQWEEAVWGTCRGVGGFQAPEVECGGPPSILSDIWALGIMLFKAVFPSHSTLPDEADGGGVIVPQHEDECLRSLLHSMLRTDPLERLQTADQVAVHPFLAQVSGGRPSSPDSLKLVIQSEWKVHLVREYGRRLQAERPPAELTISQDQIVDSTLAAFLNLTQGGLVHPLHITFVSMASLPLSSPKQPPLTMATFYSCFFDQILRSPLNLVETCSGSAYLPSASASVAFMDPKSQVVPSLELLGRVMVKCVIDGYPIPPVFGPSLPKFLLGEAPTLQDLEPFHPHLATKLNTLLSLNFQSSRAQQISLLQQIHEIILEINLLLGSSDSKMPSLNDRVDCEEYVMNIIEQVLIDSRKPQLNALKEGFSAVDLSCYLLVFSSRDLSFLFTSPVDESNSNTTNDKCFYSVS
eukprot:CAMPEP_0196578402 /NCGR_PEP_ID=MMETSP1081-20130531/7306_1 /TAXON_ID=36882 /ORGANISM="Pyramimonas amylifera, Strain CCMP720" /LENGTH=470 /DNA_ID=CAMNT_0041897607 /DNA_START=174 /DNA_END=1586 /DNA_ORIENTATION=+